MPSRRSGSTPPRGWRPPVSTPTRVAAQRRWALELADRSLDLVIADDQVALLDVLVREQNNLTDVLRHALSVGDREVVARLVALLGEPLDRHRRPASHLRDLRPGRRAAHRLGGARGADPPRPGGGGRADDPPQLDARRRPERSARPAPAGRPPGRSVGSHRAHRPRRRPSRQTPRCGSPRSPPGSRPRWPAPCSCGPRSWGRTSATWRRAACPRRAGPGPRAAAALPHRLAARRAQPARDGRRRPPPRRRATPRSLAAAGAGALADRPYSLRMATAISPAARRRRRPRGRDAGGVRRAGRRDRPDGRPA